MRYLKNACVCQGLSLAVKGPLFNQLESQRPAVLAQVLAQATFRGPRPLDATQVRKDMV